MPITQQRRSVMQLAALAWLAVIGPGLHGAPADESASAAEPQQQVQFLGLQTALPGDWQRRDPSSSMRLMQFVVPGNAPGQSAELIFYYFGAGQGGTPEANITRWRSQFRAADGAPSMADVVRFDVEDIPITRVKLQGRYARGIGAGPGGGGKPNQTLLAAMLQTPRGQVTIQLHGDTPLIDSIEAAFDRMLRRVEPLTAR
ncbi:MAG: hypothetical protein QNJ91_12730 [Gammaproteobacteria bacterium]|nr:hypothetical protein [Gammaproteobacteria bacterium]